MLVAFLRLGRRTKEIIIMTLTEVMEAEMRLIDGQRMAIIAVADHKNSKSGEVAPVTFSEVEFAALNL